MIYISPSEIANKTGLSRADANKVLQELSKMGIMKKKFVCTCGECKQIYAEYDGIEELPETFVCENCGKETENILADTYAVFKHW